jgi:hypothetical protein
MSAKEYGIIPWQFYYQFTAIGYELGCQKDVPQVLYLK